jgi:hypothetical protein
MKINTFIINCFFVFFFFLLIGTGKCNAGINSDSLQYLGNAFVKITTSEGKIIYIDPYAINQSDSADIILITHEHSDHNDLSRVQLKATGQVIRVANALLDTVYQTFTIGNITIKAVPAYNQYHLKSQGVGYVIEFDSIKVYHAGGTGKIPEMANLANQNITYALLHMTPGPELMTEAAALIQAKHDIPIHTTVSLQRLYDDALVARFTSPNKLIVTTDQTIALTTAVTSVIENNSMPYECRLFQNYPNPFNPVTSISYSVPNVGYISLKVYNMQGREIATLANEIQQPGVKTVRFNSTNLPSGIYFCRLSFVRKGTISIETNKLVLLK